MDSVGQGATHHPIKIHKRRMEKRQKRKCGREPRKVENSKTEKAETMGKEKVNARRDNVSTKSQNHQRNSGQVDLGHNGLNNLGAQKLTLRVGVTMIGTLQIRILRLQQQPKNFSVRLFVLCGSRIWVMSNTSNLFNMTDEILHSELSHLVLIPQHAKLLFLLITMQHVGIWSTKIHYWNVRTALQKRILCTLDETGKPMAIESRKVNCRRPLMAVTEMTDCGRWVCLFQF